MPAQPRWKLVLPLCFAGVMVLGILIGFQLKEKTMAPGFYTGKKASSLQELSLLLGKRYVDSLGQEEAEAMVAQAVLSRLDPHSQFLAPAAQSQLQENMEGHYGGIGLEYRILQDSLVVTGVRPGGPADGAGLRVGARLLRLNDSVLLSGPQREKSDLRLFFRGAPGSSLRLAYWQDNAQRQVVLKREELAIDPVAAAYLVKDSIAYIRLTLFSDRSYLSFMRALDSLQQKGMRALVLDLRGNGGGLLKEAVAIADEFIADQKLLVYTAGAHLPRQDYFSQKPGMFENGRLAVLIDGGSASASEVLAGALQDHGRAKLFGRPSFGKGLVQQQFQLSNGSAVQLTVARYFTPKGRNLQRPYAGGGGEPGDNPHQVAPGGAAGGLAPDVTVPFSMDLLNDQVANPLVYDQLFAFSDFLVRQPSATWARFFPGPGLPPAAGEAGFVNEQFQAFLQAAHLTLPKGQAWSPYSLNLLKALVYKSKLGNTAFYQQSNATDPVVLSAVQWLQTGK